jgi:hypothetical protein
MSIEAICKGISNAIEKARTPAQKIPAILAYCCAINRPGLSAMTLASRIIQRQSEAGAPFGAAADGTANIAEAMERIRAEEIIRAIRMESFVEVVIPPAGIQVTGANGPSSNPMPVKGVSYVR